MDKTPSEYFSRDYFFGRKKSNYHNYNLWDCDSNWRHIKGAVKKNKMSGKVLDVGCAFGFLLKRLIPYFSELQGLDISEYAIERARKEVPDAKFRVINIDTDDLPYPDDYFDLVTVLDVLEHTKSIENNLNKIIKKLRRKGYLIITLPLKETWAGKIFGYFDKDITHISIPSDKEIFKIAELSGLKIIEKKYFFNLILFRIKHIPASIELILQKR